MLRQNGQVTRNEALRNFISRLCAYIAQLKREGWKITGQWDEYHRDYIYKLEKAPYIPKMVYDKERNCMVIINEPKQTNIW
jgi:hypothetical protein